MEYYPLTENQLGIYLDCMAHPGSIGYHLPNVIRMDPSADPERLMNAVVQTVEHHSYLKVTLITKGGEVLQRRDDDRQISEAFSFRETASFSDEMAEEMAAVPFDLNGGLLFRFGIFRTPGEVVLVSVFHHLIVDGGSLNIFFRDIAAAYDGRKLSDEKVSGYQISLREKAAENSPAYVKARDYYAKRLSIADEATLLTPDLKGDADTGRLGVERFGVDTVTVDALCKKCNISQNVLFMSVLYVVLTKFISDDRLLLATVSNGRLELDEMPYTPNGKLDRKNLPEPVIKKEYVEPATGEEAFFCQIFEQVLDMENIGATSDFFSVGGSSLLATQLTILASNGGFDIKFRDVFDNPTPRKLAAFVTGRGTGENAAERAELKDINEYDYSVIHEYLKQNNFENYDSGNRRRLAKVLLTGATGFLGIHILRELLEQEDVIVYCMLRGSRGQSAAVRLKNRLFYYFDDNYERLEGIRLIVREGAITDESSFAAFDDDPIDTVINCAASVKHFSAGTDIYDTNVTGVKNGLDYAIKRGIRYVHISTTSTAGEILLDGEHEIFTYDEKTLYKGQILDNQYLSSKFLSERMVLESAANGADTKIIRVGNLMARDSDGLFQINFPTNGFIGRLRAYVTVNGMPFEKMLHKAEFSPIDITARAIVALSASPKECCLFNCYNNHTVSYGDILHAANEMGVPIEAVTSAEFDRRMDDAMHDEKKQEGISGLITTVGMGTKKERLLTAVNNDYTIKCLYRENIFWPILSEQYLETFINFLKGLGFWGE